MAAAAAATWFSRSARFNVAATKAASWRISSDWAMAWAGIPDVKVVSPKERVINGDIFESCLELDPVGMTHAWSYDRVPGSWGIGETPQMHGRVTVLDGDSVNTSVVEYTMSAAGASEESVAGMLAHEVSSVGPKLVAYIEAHASE